MPRYELKDITIKLVDVAEEVRLLYGEKAEYIAGRPIPEKDLRFEVTAERDGRKSTLSCPADIKLSAEDFLALVNRDRR